MESLNWRLITIILTIVGALTTWIWNSVTADVAAQGIAMHSVQRQVDVNSSRIDTQEKHLDRIEDKLDVVLDHVINDHGGYDRLPPDARGRLHERP